MLNTSFRIAGEQTSLAAELLAIEYAINNIPINTSAIIITDNKTAIMDINNMELMTKNKIANIKHRSIVKRIVKVIKDRKKIGSETSLIHIYSHMKDKIKKSDPEKKKKWIEKINKRKEELGYNWGLYIKGNEEADKLADKGADMEKVKSEINTGNDNFAIIKNEIIERNIQIY